MNSSLVGLLPCSSIITLSFRDYKIYPVVQQSRLYMICMYSITSSSWKSIIELCEIRDGLSSCEALSNDDVRKLIELIC